MLSVNATDDSVPDRGPAVFAVTTATFVLASVMVAARLFCRRFIVRNVSWDDKTMFFAWLIAFGLSFTICFGTRKGLGRYDKDIPQGHWDSLRACEYVFSILYNPALMATKTSVLIFYLRLSKNTKKVLRFASWVTLGIVNVAGAVLTLINIFQCQPVQAAWEIWRDTSRCIPLLTEFICSAPINIVTDLAILALPIPVLTGMRLPPRQKIILVLTFTLGIFVTIVDVVRIYYLQQAVTSVPTGVSTDPNSHFGGTPDFAWNSSLSFMWSAVEVNVGMACACIPTLKPLIIKILPAMIIDPDGTRSSTNTEKDAPESPRNRNGSDGLVSPTNPNHRASVNLQEPAPATFRASRDLSGVSNEYENSMTALEFLTTPDMTLAEFEASGASRLGGDPARASMATSRENTIYFGFVNMRRPKSMVKCDAQESFRYGLVVTILFVMWGISYGLLNTLNNVISSVSDMSVAQTLGLTTAYFGGGYFFGPLLVGEWILRRDEHHRRHRKNNKRDAESVGGFKVTFIVGLCFYGVGTIIFWPSAVTKSWGGFLLSNFVVGFGLSVLETGANAFLILCGPPEYGETRLLLAQGVQGIGAVLSGLMAQRVFFTKITNKGGSDSTTLLNVQWTYLAITLLCVALGLFFYYMPLPELNDNELQESADRLPVNPQKRSIGGLQLRTWSLILAVLAQWTYVASQESNNIFFRSLLIAALPNQEDSGSGATNADTNPGENSDKPPGLTIGVTDFHLVAQSVFTVSRFMVAYLTYMSVRKPRMPKPRTWLGISVGLCILFGLLTVVWRPKDPNMLMIPVILFYFAEGPVWPLIFAIGLRGQGRRTKRAAAFITMGGSGAAFFPYVIYAIINGGATVQLSFVVIVALSVLTAFYPIWLMFVRDAKTMTDPANSYISPEERVMVQDEIDMSREVRRRRRSLFTIGAKGKRGSIFSMIYNIGKAKGESVTPPTVEHSEERNTSSKASEGSNDTPRTQTL
ncbi:fucose permease [Colletotrichum graminicola]|uniref:Fucose permease n=1 Tax=Colletotrichum graminicola (strain M1.001 / M2 / FGSC 10212) TaxID=645133 RepID=E3QVX4_COLGM|nr:fucose permease [Colletotrichum graminicola M1.001]EFQ35012.1 fucose permease [Colletotrichum graminicola M1.001]WDK20355.1 fucose permease [Colletotrichum graminicola]